MRLFCYVYEDEYEGLHGIETLFVDDFLSFEGAVDACREEGESLVDFFSLHMKMRMKSLSESDMA